MKVAIAGGGIIGLSIALELRARGAEAVVFDRTPGAEASVASGGMLAPQKEADRPGPFLDCCLLSRTMWPAFEAMICEKSGAPSSYLPSGILLSAFTDDEVHAIDATAAWQKACGLRVDVLTGDEARKQQPGLSPAVASAGWFPDEHQIDPGVLMPALLEACVRSGVRFERAEVTRIIEEHGRVAGVQHAGGIERAQHVVLAAGAWSSQLGIPGLIEPVRGQMVELRGITPPSSILGGPRCYVIPRAGGRVVAGTTQERVGFDTGVTEAGIAKILAAVAELFPPLAEAKVTGRWAGLRPWSSTGFPVIGPGPLEGLVLATGHYRNGVLLAPLTARVVGQILSGEKPSVDLKPFRYDRVSL